MDAVIAFFNIIIDFFNTVIGTLNKIAKFLEPLNSKIIWGLPMVILMIGTGVFLLVLTKGVIFRKFGVLMKYTAGTIFKRKKPNERGEGTITPFQAVCTALAATVGTGNIVGVALAIATGGPGAVFWLWVSALVGMVIKYCEVTLSMVYRGVNNKLEIVGGPMYYISNGIGSKFLAMLFAFFGAMASFGIGASVQSNSLASGLNSAFGIPTYIIGIVVVIIAALVIMGGIKRIANVTEILVPVMALFYIGGALVVLVLNIKGIPEAFGSIFKSAFTGTAATGGFLGASVMYAMRIGMARGVFTHEAGMGSAPIAHASADNDHPARQGLWGAFEVFLDSIVMCTITALVILTSGLWQTGMDESTISLNAFGQAFTGGEYIVSVGLTLFAFATAVAWYYYGEKCVEYLTHENQIVIRFYQILYIAMIYFGCISKIDVVWEFADLFNGLMAIPNLIALILLAPVIKRLTEDFFSDPHRIRPKDEDYSVFKRGKKK